MSQSISAKALCLINSAIKRVVLGWASAVAGYGAFYIPQVFGEHIKAAAPEYAMVGFAVFYA